MKKICVIGSINVDLVTAVDRFPKPGETIAGKEFNIFPGGKGTNQAVAASRLGGDVMMIGKVGTDTFGKDMIETIRNQGVDTTGVGMDDSSTGTACIMVAGSSENSIIVTPGANNGVSPSFINDNLCIVNECDIILLQFEVPFESVEYAVKQAYIAGKLVIVDPAPVRFIPDELYKYIDIITPNETELEGIAGMAIRSQDDRAAAARKILDKGVKIVINKVGSEGAFIYRKEGCRHIRAFTVAAVDTTAAGDTFNAGLSVGIALGKSIEESVLFANAAAAISTTKMGAQSAMPKFEECERLIEQQVS